MRQGRGVVSLTAPCTLPPTHMRPHPRIRKVVKWGGAVLAAVLLTLFTIDSRYYVRYCPSSGASIVVRSDHVGFYSQ